MPRAPAAASSDSRRIAPADSPPGLRGSERGDREDDIYDDMEVEVEEEGKEEVEVIEEVVEEVEGLEEEKVEVVEVVEDEGEEAAEEEDESFDRPVEINSDNSLGGSDHSPLPIRTLDEEGPEEEEKEEEGKKRELEEEKVIEEEVREEKIEYKEVKGGEFLALLMVEEKGSEEVEEKVGEKEDKLVGRKEGGGGGESLAHPMEEHADDYGEAHPELLQSSSHHIMGSRPSIHHTSPLRALLILRLAL